MAFVPELRRELRGKNLSGNNKSKWKGTYELVADELAIEPSEVYCTFIGKAANAQVRLPKQMKSDEPYKVALAFGGDGKRDAKPYESHSRRALEQHPTVQAVVLMFEEGSPGSGNWRPEQVFARPDAPLLNGILAWNPNMEQTLVEDLGKPAEATVFGALVSREPTVDPALLTHLYSMLRREKNVLLTGVPGVGKTYLTRSIIQNWSEGMAQELAEYRLLVLHPSSSYEDLVEGLRPVGNGEDGDFLATAQSVEGISFAPVLGRMAAFTKKAALAPHQDFLLVLDEMNRTNLASAFGEFLLLIEASKRAQWDASTLGWVPPIDGRVSLTYSGRTFFLPDNLYVLGTMNTADISISPMDRALARRFMSYRLEPLDTADIRELLASADPEVVDVFDKCSEVWEALNDGILMPHLGPDAMIGHSSLVSLAHALDTGATPRASGRQFLQSALLPQVIHALSDVGQEDLLLGLRAPSERALQAATTLGQVLEAFGLQLSEEGEGLGKRLVLVEL